jgi:O-antigen ligase
VPAVPVKDYIIQSTEFVLCAFALGHLAIDAWRTERRAVCLALGALALAFLANVVFVATGRTALAAFPILLALLAAQRFGWRGIAAAAVAGGVLATTAWVSSPYLRARVVGVVEEIRQYRSENAETSVGYRLEFWKKSVEFVAAAPIIGHGTGAIEPLFRRASVGDAGIAAAVTANPHNQTLEMAIQLGLIGVALLYAMWIGQIVLFRGSGLAAWLGMAVVAQSIVGSLFLAYVTTFTTGWIYAFGVGVLGGMARPRIANGE